MQQPPFVQEFVSGSSLTTMQIGGEVRYFVRATSEEILKEALTWARELSLPIRVLGGGSNVILPDAGFSGVIIRLESSMLRVLSDDETGAYVSHLKIWTEMGAVEARHTQGGGAEALQLPKQEQEMEEGELVCVELGAGVLWGQAVMWSLQQCLVGLEWFSRIPCRVGGAVFNNIHGGTRFFSEYVVAVHAVNREGDTFVFGPNQLQFGYDISLFHERRDLIVTRVICALRRVSPEYAQAKKELYLNWTKEKARVQPSGPNCGSVFQNLDDPKIVLTPLALSEKISEPEEGWSRSAGRYIDLAGCKGIRVGGVEVYRGHANFICNVGVSEGAPGTEADLRELIATVQKRVAERFTIHLIPEVEFIGDHD